MGKTKKEVKKEVKGGTKSKKLYIVTQNSDVSIDNIIGDFDYTGAIYKSEKDAKEATVDDHYYITEVEIKSIKTSFRQGEPEKLFNFDLNKLK